MRKNPKDSPTIGQQILTYLNHLFIDGFLNPISHAYKLLETSIFFIMMFLFFVTAILTNLLQLVNFVALELIAPRTRRWINHLLQNIVLSSLIYIFEYRCEISFSVAFDSQATANSFCREQASLLVVNHSFQLDVLFMWFTAQMISSLGTAKGFAKRSLQWMPIIGWMFMLNDSILLDRNWEQDKQSIEEGLEKIRKNSRNYQFVIAPEGTRFTEKKHQQSVDYAQEHDIDVNLNYHLLPRAKGFATTVRCIRAAHPQSYDIYNMELISARGKHWYTPTIAAFMAGKPLKVDCFIEKVPHELLPENVDASDAEYAQTLYRIFERKDEIVQQYRSFGKVAQSVVRQRKYSIARWFKFMLFNVLLTGSLVLCMLQTAYYSDSALVKTAVWSFVIGVYGGIYAIFQMTKISNYGMD